jgi:hypothetical protein
MTTKKNFTAFMHTSQVIEYLFFTKNDPNKAIITANDIVSGIYPEKRNTQDVIKRHYESCKPATPNDINTPQEPFSEAFIRFHVERAARLAVDVVQQVARYHGITLEAHSTLGEALRAHNLDDMPIDTLLTLKSHNKKS